MITVSSVQYPTGLTDSTASGIPASGESKWGLGALPGILLVQDEWHPCLFRRLHHHPLCFQRLRGTLESHCVHWMKLIVLILMLSSPLRVASYGGGLPRTLAAGEQHQLCQEEEEKEHLSHLQPGLPADAC
jgi:hypothetical protein